MDIAIEQLIAAIHGSQKTLWILCGLPYSGKTYFSKKIVAATSVAYVSIDYILEELGFDWDSGRLPDERGWKKVFDISYARSKEALQNNLSVLYDSTNHTRTSRDAVRKVAEEVGADARVVFVDSPVEIIWKRWGENVTLKNRSVVAKELVETTIKSFEPPMEDEMVYRMPS